MTFNSLFSSLLAAYACGATGSYTHDFGRTGFSREDALPAKASPTLNR